MEKQRERERSSPCRLILQRATWPELGHLSLCLHEAGTEMEQPGLKLMLIWDTDVARSGLIHCIATPVSADSLLK